MRKGQVSMFVIVGIVVLIGVGFFLYLGVNGKLNLGENLKENPEVSPLVQECVQRFLVQARPTLAMQGGYIVVPEPQVVIEGLAVPVVSQEINYSTIENQIDLLLNTELYACVLDNPKSKAFPGFSGDTFTSVSSHAEFVGRYVRVLVNYTYNNKEYQLVEEDDMHLLEPIEIANEIIRSNIATHNDKTILAGIKVNHDASIELIPYGDSTVYYVEKGDDYFTFAMSD